MKIKEIDKRYKFIIFLFIISLISFLVIFFYNKEENKLTVTAENDYSTNLKRENLLSRKIVQFILQEIARKKQRKFQKLLNILKEK
ncbi:hypothetical protein [Caproiciproducens sp. MSJ-32]|uniref:hypothetical protein n=1 Tax=Caproiciproducens sp. MSJ-32 TaxID=2841527 RepID=UPI001C1116BD|nr:hypothetical protein [Caproiciproducens sp. MSJ-32]MBU5455365.1 hypothetical protein [Caproiciproducens sp. MSJ-32]